MTRPTPRSELILLVVLLTVSVVIRTAHLIAIADTDLALIPLLDSQTYHQWAIRLASGDWGWYEAYWMGPLYPHLLALVYAAIGVDIPVVLALQLALSVLNIWLVFKLGHVLLEFGRPPERGVAAAPLLAAALYSFYGPAVFYAGLLLMATVVTTLMLLVALQAARAAADPRPRAWFLLGVLVGLVSLARGNVLFLLAVLPVLILKSNPRPARKRALGALLLGGLLMVLPVTVRNAVMAGDFVLLTSNGGVNLLIGQQTEHRGMFAPVDDRLPAEFDPSQEMTLERDYGRDLKGSEVSAILARRAWEKFRDDLPAMPLHYLRKIYRFWNGYELPQIESYDYWRGEFTTLRLLPVPFVLIGAAGFLGLRFLPTRSRWILGLVVGGYFLSLLPFFPTARYRLPVVPMLAVPAAALLCALGSRRADLRVWLPALAAAVVFLWPGWTAFDQGEVLWQVRLHDAARAARRGDLPAVLARGRQAEEARPGLADTPYLLSQQLEELGALAEAQAALRLAESRAPQNPLIVYRLGRYREQSGDPDGALEAFARAEDLDPDWFYPWLRSGLILRAAGRQDEALRAMRTAYRLSPGNRRVRANLGSLLAESGDFDEARFLLTALTRDDPRYVNGWFNLALAEWNAGNRDAARAHLARAAGLKNLSPEERRQVERLQAVFAAQVP